MIDTHCHLYDTQAFPDPAAVIEAAKAAGVDRIVVIGIDSETSRQAVAMADQFAEVYASVGWHPNHAAEYKPSELDEIRRLAAHPKVVALGEMGLDFHWDFATREQQERCLADQLELAKDLALPIVFHCREANDALLEILERDPPASFVLHCFGGDASHAERALAMGAYLGVDGPVTFPKNQALRDLIASTPRDRWLIETDAPYLAPVPYRGKQNQPAYVRMVCETVADVWGVSTTEAEQITTQNAERFYRLAPRA